jgi:tetratricopeptide (TPR) repeat protein
MQKENKKKSASVLINLLLVCLSLSPFAALELYLRSIDYGYEDRLFVLDQEVGEYVLNQPLYQKYFPTDPLLKNSRIPELLPEMSFAAQKGDNVFRIFCLGGSTTRGDFSDNRFPDLLAEMLVRSEVDKKVEVFNLGITTFNSYQVADFVAELVDYAPDLLIIYMGHNEIYGPLGVASSSQVSSSHRLTKTVLLLQRFKTFQLLQNYYLKLIDIDSDADRQGALFKFMAKSSVEPFSPLKEKSLKYFSNNLDNIIAQVKKRDAPLILTTIASNIRDFRPFDSAVPEGSLAKEWQSLIDSAVALKDKGNLQEAAETFLQAIDLYPDNAQQYFDLGQVCMSLKMYGVALESLTKAKDLDIIPFRAPSGINRIIRQKAVEPGFVILDVEEIYKTKSEDGLIGKPIMIEHLHPSAYGHYLIAAGLTELVFETGLLQAGKEIDFADPAVRAEFNAAINSEDFDGSEMWPFTINNKDYRFP